MVFIIPVLGDQGGAHSGAGSDERSTLHVWCCGPATLGELEFFTSTWSWDDPTHLRSEQVNTPTLDLFALLGWCWLA